MENFLNEVRKAARKEIIYTQHALNEMNVEKEIVSCEEIRDVIFKGEIIEDYPEDKRGHSCLMFNYTLKQKPVHIVCSPKQEFLGIITVYIPTLDKWEDDFRTRRLR